MKVDFKKLASSALSVAMVASLGGCALLGGNADEDVIAAAEDYADAIVKFKAADILDMIEEPNDDFAEGLEAFMDHSASTYGDDYDAICGAIEGTFSYEIDEESVESSKKDGEGSVDITFTYVDYQAVYDDVIADGGDVDAFVAALADGDTQEVTQSISFVLNDDDEWKVDDAKGKKVQELYQFYLDAFDFEFAAAISTDLIDHVEWYYSDNDVYTDVYTIELDIIPTDEGQEIEWEFTYEYYLDGQLIYTSDECTDQGYWIESYYGTSYDSQAATDDNGYLIAGSYECIVYDLAGNVLADSTCTVENGGSTTVVTPSGGDDYETWENGIDDYWYTYADGGSSAMGSGDYTTSESIIEYTCQVIDEANLAYFPVYYEVYYSADGDMSNAEFIYSATITPSEYTNGYFYEFQYVADDTLDAGSYYLIGATDEAGSTILFNVEATVS
ncbi:MAG: hypothetical protein IJ757_00305 [Clostridiales bacterium]|nr:hypothetical protein [Clostridiales bacterium]